MATWIGNHDVPRAIHFASRQIRNCTEGTSSDNGWTSNFAQPGDAAPYERLALAFAVMMTNPGVPLIYYGDEIGLAGGGDPDNRRMMPWSSRDINGHQEALRSQVRFLARLRADHKVLGRGRRTTIHQDQNIWAYRMGGCGEAKPVIVAINKSDGSQSFNLAGDTFRNLRTGRTVTAGPQSLPPRSFLILEQAAP